MNNLLTVVALIGFSWASYAERKIHATFNGSDYVYLNLYNPSDTPQDVTVTFEATGGNTIFVAGNQGGASWS